MHALLFVNKQSLGRQPQISNFYTSKQLPLIDRNFLKTKSADYLQLFLRDLIIYSLLLPCSISIDPAFIS